MLKIMMNGEILAFDINSAFIIDKLKIRIKFT